MSANNPAVTRPRVVIIGGGFGGLSAARALEKAPVDVTLIDRRNFHLFQPLLYQVATGGLSPANIAAPLRSILSRQRNARILLGEVVAIDTQHQRAILADGEAPYDFLIVATGSSHHYFGHDEWASAAPGLKTVEDALEIRRRVFLAFEAAERETDPEAARAWLTFVIVGGGPTGVELAGALGEIARYTLRRDYRSIDPSRAQIILLEAAERVLPSYPPSLSREAERSLAHLGVEVRTSTTVVDVKEDSVTVEREAKRTSIRARTVLWAAGVRASPLGAMLATATGAELDRAGRLIVTPDLALPGFPVIFAIGDLAAFVQDGKQLPAVAQVAMQQGRHAAAVIEARLAGQSGVPFRYRDFGNMATIGRSSAVADLGRIKLSGFIGWIAWLTIHLMNLARYENRVLVLVQWAWNYFTRNRSARLITGRDLTP